MNLFDKIPEKLFVLLAGKNRKIYAEALFLLLEWHQKGGRGTEYNEMREPPTIVRTASAVLFHFNALFFRFKLYYAVLSAMQG